MGRNLVGRPGDVPLEVIAGEVMDLLETGDKLGSNPNYPECASFHHTNEPRSQGEEPRSQGEEAAYRAISLGENHEDLMAME